LAHSPNDPDDGGWPHKIIRNVIESKISSDMEHGFVLGKYNMRGVTSRGIFEGGHQERELAKQYQEYAELVKMRWHKTADILKSMAEKWIRDAEREDTQAKQSDIMRY